MSEFREVQTVSDFVTLDDADMLEGYLDGFHATGVPDSSRSRSYWHGWRNGRIESRRVPIDVAHLRLARTFDARQDGAPDDSCFRVE